MNKINIAVLVVATGNYLSYATKMIESFQKHFLPGYKKTFVVFTDKEIVEIRQLNVNCIDVQVTHLPWPLGTMIRYHYYLNFLKTTTIPFDYIFHTDADVLAVSDIIPEEVFHPMVAVRHCGFLQSKGTYETNPKSSCYVSPAANAKYYFGGSFTGGTKAKFIDFATKVTTMLNQDLQNRIIPIWHEESAINKVLNEQLPDKILPPTFHYPEGNEYLLKQLSQLQFPTEPKIIVLDKGSPDQVQKIRE